MINGIRIIATYSCSKRCKFCYQSSYDSAFLTANNLKNVLSTINTPVNYVTLMGGEVSEFPEKTNELLDVLKNYNNISITTNGFGDLSWYETLFSKNIANITFSMPCLNKSICDKLIHLSKIGNVRVNCFFDRLNPKKPEEVLNFCRVNNINLTLCEDIYKKELYKENLLDGLNLFDVIDIEDNEQYCIITLSDNYKFWIYRHVNNYDNDNVIILPNGNITYDFNDVVNGLGNR